MQTCPDGDFKYILNYQDHISKYLVLRPLRTKRAEEVAYCLIDIFCILGAPSVLQSDNGREFANRIVEELKLLWPQLSIVHGKPRHSQSQGSVERSNQDVENILFAWMDDNKTKRWSEGLRFCQLQKNNAYHSGIRQTPFEAMFGRKAHIGIQTLPDSVKKVLKTEEELEEALATVDSNRSGATNNLEQEKSDSENDNSKPLSSSTQNLCAICSTETSGPHKCRNCGEIVHLRCAQSTSGTSTNDDEEGFGASILCLRCAQTISATINKEVAYEGLRVQAEKMKQLSQKKFPEIQVGESVTVPVSSLDRGKGDARNILGVVMEKNCRWFL